MIVVELKLLGANPFKGETLEIIVDVIQSSIQKHEII
jgi:hypothetical protein